MTGFEPETSGVRSEQSTNWATITARDDSKIVFLFTNALFVFVNKLQMHRISNSKTNYK